MLSDTETQLIRCPACGAVNRVKLESQAFNRVPVCGKCESPLPLKTRPQARPVVITDKNFATEVEASPLPVLLDLWASWCGPCRALAPIIDQLAEELNGRVRVAKLDVDKHPIVASHFNVRSIPTLLLLKNGREVGRIVGAQSKADILRRIQTML